jgi:serine/threonine-protein kinase
MLLPADAYPKAKEAALKAIELDPELAEAHSALGVVRTHYEWNWQDAEASYRRALELNPNAAWVFPDYARLLAGLGRFDEALRVIGRGRELDPVGPHNRETEAFILYLARRYDSAIQQMLENAATDPEGRVVMAPELLPFAYEAAGKAAEAFAQWQEWAEVTGLAPATVAELDAAYASGGLTGYWQKRLELEERELEETGNAWPMHIAAIHARLGHRDRAMEWLESAVAERGLIFLLGVDPRWDPLRGDPRFQALLQRLKLPAASGGVSPAS